MFSKEGTCETNKNVLKVKTLVQFPYISLNGDILYLVGRCGQYCVCDFFFPQVMLKLN